MYYIKFKVVNVTSLRSMYYSVGTVTTQNEKWWTLGHLLNKWNRFEGKGKTFGPYPDR